MPPPCFTAVTSAVTSGTGSLKRDPKASKKPSSLTEKVTLKVDDLVFIPGTVMGEPEYGESGQLVVNVRVQDTILQFPIDSLRPRDGSD
ncbi:hypothetical protein AURDEDRAFT_112846 [Auricularia subglabra TFB-10046 SS5]|nr:hypothetical protein AURDEDRAFT_112846 [Auricularia subglabra TFB-10046 SS5]